uniref:Uncharacterized protein n=1 Tax=Caenorhabditis japonica TaxID=281687 RepID=A0A8R1EC50_CAEJA
MATSNQNGHHPTTVTDGPPQAGQTLKEGRHPWTTGRAESILAAITHTLYSLLLLAPPIYECECVCVIAHRCAAASRRSQGCFVWRELSKRERERERGREGRARYQPPRLTGYTPHTHTHRYTFAR